MIATHPYIPSPEQQQREYRQRFPVGYVPREDSLVVMTDQPSLKRAPVMPAVIPDAESQAKARETLIRRPGPGMQRSSTSRAGRIGALLRSEARAMATHEIVAAIDDTDIKAVRHTLAILIARGEVEQLTHAKHRDPRRYRALTGAGQ